MNKVYTIGYEGKDIEDFIDILNKHDIKQIVDVRTHPKSRKKDFNKETLEKKLFQKSVKYEHLPELGGLGDKDYKKVMSGKKWRQSFEVLKTIIEKRRSALMCLENNPMKCHRRFISEELEKEDWEVVHIGEGGSWKGKRLDDF